MRLLDSGELSWASGEVAESCGEPGLTPSLADGAFDGALLAGRGGDELDAPFLLAFRWPMPSPAPDSGARGSRLCSRSTSVEKSCCAIDRASTTSSPMSARPFSSRKT